MRAAHSIKGSMSMVTMYLGQDSGSALAVGRASGPCSGRVPGARREWPLALTSADIDVLLGSVDLLGRTAAAVGPGLTTWFSTNGPTLTAMRERLAALAEGGPATANFVPSMPKPVVEEPTPASQSTDGTAEEEPGKEGELANDESRQPLLDLFQSEMTTHAEELRKGLDQVENASWENVSLEGVLRAARWARSAAHICPHSFSGPSGAGRRRPLDGHAA